MSSSVLKAPFPYFGGKSRIADLVWQRFGVVDNYVEPFFGSGAMLLAAPWPADRTETVNDADGLLANFWRALQQAPDEVAYYADWPVNEADLHARHRWLVDRRSLVEELMQDPDWYDAKAAGWWVWGISQWIGTGWCPRVGAAPRQAPHLWGSGQGVNRQLPILAGDNSAAGGGVYAKKLHLSQKLPALGSHRGVASIAAGKLGHKMPFIAGDPATGWRYGLGIHGKRLNQKMLSISDRREGGFNAFESSGLYDYFQALAARLRRVRVVCGDFERILGPSVTWRHGLSAIFLDPPYSDAEHAINYSGGGGVWDRVTAWCEANGDRPLLRIALCGYEGTWEPPAGWEAIEWRTPGGYGSQGNGRGRENASREVVWFSPNCLTRIEDLPLFAQGR